MLKMVEPKDQVLPRSFTAEQKNVAAERFLRSTDKVVDDDDNTAGDLDNTNDEERLAFTTRTGRIESGVGKSIAQKIASKVSYKLANWITPVEKLKYAKWVKKGITPDQARFEKGLFYPRSEYYESLYNKMRKTNFEQEKTKKFWKEIANDPEKKKKFLASLKKK